MDVTWNSWCFHFVFECTLTDVDQQQVACKVCCHIFLQCWASWKDNRTTPVPILAYLISPRDSFSLGFSFFLCLCPLYRGSLPLVSLLTDSFTARYHLWATRIFIYTVIGEVSHTIWCASVCLPYTCNNKVYYLHFLNPFVHMTNRFFASSLSLSLTALRVMSNGCLMKSLA